MAAVSSQSTTQHLIRVVLEKPSEGTWRRSGRTFLGVAFPQPEFWPSDAIGVPISCTFYDFPSCGRLFGGDEIRAVGGEPVATTKDLVFHWDRAPPGRLSFDVLRQETHRLLVGPAALRQIEITWMDRATSPSPLVASTRGTEELLRKLQQPAFLEAGDLVLRIGATPVGTSEEAAAALRQATAAGETVEISLRRGWPEPIHGEKPPHWIWQCFGTPTTVAVPKAKRRKELRKQGDQSGGAMLADLAPRLVEDTQDEPQVPV